MEDDILKAQLGIAKSLPVEFLDCRGLGHAWQQANPTMSHEGNEALAFVCLRCHTVRHDFIGGDGYLTRRHYHYPPRYSLKKLDSGDRPVSARALRIERIRRARYGKLKFPDIGTF